MDAKAQTLGQASQKLGEKMYADAQAAGNAAGAGGAEQADGAKKEDDSNVVDAEFTEVKDGKK